jgi:hypothetical protein
MPTLIGNDKAVMDWDVLILIKLGGNFDDFFNAEVDTPAQVEWIENKDEMKRHLFVFLRGLRSC